MLRKLKIASAVVACTAALGLGFAAPASAAPAAPQALIAGFAYESTDASGDGVPLLSNVATCAPIGIDARSAQNITVATDETVITLYSDDDCEMGDVIEELTAQEFELNIPANAPAVAYTST